MARIIGVEVPPNKRIEIALRYIYGIGPVSYTHLIGSLGIMPYISATIIIQLLTAVWPKLSKLAREENGRTKIIQYGRYLTVLLCLGQGLFFAIGWEHPQNIFHGFQGNLCLLYTSQCSIAPPAKVLYMPNNPPPV